MSGIHQTAGKSDEWYTPKYIFDALGVRFDLDVASPEMETHVPADEKFTHSALTRRWKGFCWMNPPYCGKGVKERWIGRLIEHGDGIALLTNDTSTDWWHLAAKHASGILFPYKRINFERPDGTTGDGAANGSTLFSYGERGRQALINAHKSELGLFLYSAPSKKEVEGLFSGLIS